MAIYHLSAKPISRAQGRSATGAAAYRAGVEITDERTGLVHDYTRKGGVLHSELILPGGGTADRAEFWNGIEAHHKRGDAVLVREVEISLPTELTPEQRQALAVGYARELADRYGVAADVALHAPRTVTDRELEKNPDQYHETDPETGRRHNGNWHAHIMLSACHVQPDGTLGKKAVELDPIHCQRHGLANVVERERERWERLANQALEKAGQEARIDHRSLEAQGIYDRAPTVHLGPDATAIKRRGGVSEIEERAMAQAAEFMADMQARVALQRAAERDVAELEAQLAAAQWEARPVSERLAEVRQEQERLLQVRRDLWARKQVADEAAKKARPQADVQKAQEALPGAVKAAGKAKAKVQELEAQESGLGWWQWLKRRRLKAAIPQAQAEAVAKVQGAVKLNELAKAPVLEKVQAEQQSVASGLDKFNQDYDPIVYQVVDLEAQQKAMEARQAEIEARRVRQAELERQAAFGRELAASVKQRRTERSEPTKAKERERDHGPSI